MTREDGVTYRRATAADLGRIEELLSSNQLPVAGVGANIEEFWLALDGEQLVGVVGLEIHGPVGLLRSVAVRTEFRKLGVARKLFGLVAADARERRLAALYLLTETAERYFERLGFVRVEREAAPRDLLASVEFRGACPASAALLHLAVSVVDCAGPGRNPEEGP